MLSSWNFSLRKGYIKSSSASSSISTSTSGHIRGHTKPMAYHQHIKTHSSKVIGPRIPRALIRKKLLRSQLERTRSPFLVSTLGQDLSQPFPSWWLGLNAERTSLHPSLVCDWVQELTTPFLVCDWVQVLTYLTTPFPSVWSCPDLTQLLMVSNRVSSKRHSLNHAWWALWASWIIPLTGRTSIHASIKSVLPLNKRGNLHKSQLVSEIHDFFSRKWLRNYISCMLIDGYVLEPYHSPLNHVMDVVVLDLNMLQFFMEHEILWKLHTTFIITLHHCPFQLFIEQSYK